MKALDLNRLNMHTPYLKKNPLYNRKQMQL